MQNVIRSAHQIWGLFATLHPYRRSPRDGQNSDRGEVIMISRLRVGYCITACTLMFWTGGNLRSEEKTRADNYLIK